MLTSLTPAEIELLLIGLQAFATLGLVGFAAVQIWQFASSRKERQRIAYAATYGEYWRLQALADTWKQTDALSRLQNHLLDPAALQPRDWLSTLRTLGELSYGAAAFGGWAYDHMERAQEYAKRAEQAMHGAIGSTEPARWLAEAVRELEQAVMAFRDGLKTIPSYLLRHNVTIVDPESEIGKFMERRLREARSAPLRRHEPRLGFLGRWLGRRIAAVAGWFDPASVAPPFPPAPPRG